MLPRDLTQLRVPARPTLTTDGASLVYAIGGPDLEADDYVSQLWLARGEASARQLTFGHADTALLISPDGTHVAFLRREAGSKAQLWVMALDGGEPRPLTDAPLGVTQAAWSPDSTRLCYLARVPHEGRYVPGGEAAKEAPRLIRDVQYRRDNLGYCLDRPQQAFVVPFDPAEPDLPEPRQITDGSCEIHDSVWCAQGTAIALVGDFHRGHEADLRHDLRLVPVDGGEPTDVDLGVLSVEQVAAGDGFLALLAQDLGADGLDFVAKNLALYRCEPRRGELRRLSDPGVLGLVSGPGALAVRGEAVFALGERAGSAELLQFDAYRSGAPAVLVPAPAVVTSFDVDRAGRSLVAAVSRPRSPGEIETLQLDPGQHGGQLPAGSEGCAAGRTDVPAPRVVTECGAWCEPWLREPVELTVPARDGYPVHGWVTVPSGAGPHPTILLIHGGPYAQFTGSFFDETQVYVRAGYGVVQCNPRGSAGYGEAHGRAIKDGFGTVDADDVLDFFDAALADPDFALDATRTAVMGGSYGGYMTGWLTTQTDRFGCAIVERGFLDAASFVGSSDIGWFFGLQYLGPDAASPEVIAQNPMSHIARVTTPTLVIHSENDWRCPIEQGQRWFTELKLRGVETELLIFPGEGHELSRSGLPSHRIARFDHILRWLDAHL